MSAVNEVWVLASEFGFRRHSGNSYFVIRKYKRGTGYSVRKVDRFFSGFTQSGRVKKFESFEEVVKFLAREHPTVKNYAFAVYPESILEALENSEPEKREFWRSELEYLKNLVEGAA